MELHLRYPSIAGSRCRGETLCCLNSQGQSMFCLRSAHERHLLIAVRSRMTSTRYLAIPSPPSAIPYSHSFRITALAQNLYELSFAFAWQIWLYNLQNGRTLCKASYRTWVRTPKALPASLASYMFYQKKSTKDAKYILAYVRQPSSPTPNSQCDRAI